MPVPDTRPVERLHIARDALIILAAACLAVLAAQMLGPGLVSAPAAPGSLPPGATTVVLGSAGPTVTLAPLPTLGPIVNPSLHIDATPTPVPFTTLPPARRH